MTRKEKGSNAERELVHAFWGVVGWAASRVAGSGSIKYPAPDVIAGNNERVLVIECKSSSSHNQYLTKKEVWELQQYAALIRAEPIIALRFSKTPWLFLSPSQLKDTGKYYVASRQSALVEGRTFSQLATREKTKDL